MMFVVAGVLIVHDLVYACITASRAMAPVAFPPGIYSIITEFLQSVFPAAMRRPRLRQRPALLEPVDVR
jgi:hypothetical protein